MSPLTRDKDLSKVLRAFEMMRVLDREIPGQLVSAFLFIASHDGCRKTDLEKELQLTSSSGSRLTDWLSNYHRLGKPGLGLIRKRKSTFDMRVTELVLTEKGVALSNAIHRTIFD